MHPSSKINMQYFVDTYIKGGEYVLDVGSFDVNGSYRAFFDKCKYIGLDVVPGKNVDLVAFQHYHWVVDSESVDVVISGQTFEHIEYPEKTMQEIKRILKPGGLACIIAPSAGPEHGGYARDYRRYTKETIEELAGWGELDILELRQCDVAPWFDLTLIAQKPKGIQHETQPRKRVQKES